MHDESRAHSLQAFREHFSLVQGHHHGNQMETDAGAGDGGRIAAAEVAFEQPAPIARGYSDTVVANLDHQVSRLLARDDVDRTPRGRVLLETTYVAHVVRPYSTGKTAEIVAAPKVYGFDTGFVCYFRGWNEQRADDLGLLWEHYVLNELHARLQTRRINYWRDKQGHEVDFVLARRGTPPMAIECKWSADGFDPKPLKVFASRYPKAEHFIVAHDVQRAYTKRFGTLSVTFTGLEAFIVRLGV
jgi:hypothetical protein